MSSDKGSTTMETNLMIGGGIGTFRVTTRADAPPPTVVITSPVSGLTNNNRSLLTYTASAGAVVVVVDNVVVSKMSGDTLDALADGVHSVSITVTDISGRTVSASVTFAVDTAAPIVIISSPGAGAIKVNSPQLIYSASDGTVVVTVDGVVANKASWSVLDPFADGSHTVRVEATDTAGNTGIAEVSFTVDTRLDAFTIDSLPSPTRLTILTLRGTREAGASINVDFVRPSTIIIDPVSYPTATTWKLLLSGLVEGNNFVSMSEQDQAGNGGSMGIDILVDTTAPIIAIYSPAAGLTNDNKPVLGYTLDDPASVVIKLDGVILQTVPSPLGPFTNGTHTIRAEAADAAGNVGTSEVTFMVDTVPPTITINPVDSPTKDTHVTVSGMREKGANVSVSVDTSAVVGLISYKKEKTWNCTISKLVKGINTITVTASDEAGNTASVSRIIKVKDIRTFE
jgi:hypothetical protein